MIYAIMNLFRIIRVGFCFFPKDQNIELLENQILAAVIFNTVDDPLLGPIMVIIDPKFGIGSRLHERDSNFMEYEILNKNHYRNKIILTFSVVTILMVALLSKVSYDFLYDFYIDQLSENVKTNTKLTVGQIDTRYKTVLEEGLITDSALEYFEELLQSDNYEDIFSEIFLFDKNFKVLVHSDPAKIINVPESKITAE